MPREAQAFGVAAAVEQALAEPLGGRMHHVLVRLVTLCIEKRWPLTQVSEWLAAPANFLRAAQQSEDESLREYARVGFQQESKESLRALGARLNALFLWPGARQALCAPGSISFSDALAEPGLTVISTGSPPAGAERLARFFGALLLGKVVRAILSREVRPDTLPALFVAEEIQENLGPEEARQFGRLLAIARFKRAAVWVTGQSRSQLSAVDPGLVAALRANVGLQVQFRSSPEDAAAFAHLLPQQAEGETARRTLINCLTRLPQRHCYIAVRDIGQTAQLALAPRIDFDRFRAAGESLSPEARLAIRRGIAAVPRAEAVVSKARLSESQTHSTALSTDTEPEEGPFPALG
ncbi:MAG: hypothetical protein HOP12_07480 [Candidatus Eisenbacteria bacterium]|uniref:Uncharacterized protein n=1 Tax=Eiseniibacteriota bacterium TaxID=2212470 RepID=A0A849SN10_UNCEI|nr:hypothetical protein [Candidatus Eisenbacteria bacterium]